MKLPALILLVAVVSAVLTWLIDRSIKKREVTGIKLRLNMLTTLAYEILTPLNLVMGPLKTLREKEPAGKLKETYDLMYRNSLRINSIVDQVLDMRKIDEGKMKLHFRETETVNFISDILQSFDAIARQKNISVDFSAANKTQNLWVDQDCFDKIIFNLLANAFQNAPDGGRICVRIGNPELNRGRIKGSIAEFVAIDVENSGGHIPNKDSNRASTESGLGLNLVDMLVRLLYGNIVTANTEDGVKFSLFIPCGNRHLIKEELSQTAYHEALCATPKYKDLLVVPQTEEPFKTFKSRKTVLFVDDDSDMLLYVQKQLQTSFNIVTFRTAAEAWTAVQTISVDAVVADLEMPEVSGAELCHRIKSNANTALVPVIILTSHNDEEHMQEATDNGADRVLAKPISLELLRSSIIQTINNREKIATRTDNSVIYDYGSIKLTSASDKMVIKVMETIKNNIDNPDFSVEALCSEVGISRVHLNRRLKELVGVSPGYLIRSTRLKQAAFLLINNQVGIAEVAFKVGYSSLAHFSSSFHEFFNMSPKEFVSRYHGITDEDVLKEIFK